MRRPPARTLLAAALLVTSMAASLGAVGADPSPGAAEAADAPWWPTTGLDEDRDGVDDDLERQVEDADPREEVHLLVDYAEDPTAEQIQALEERGAEVVYVVDLVPTLVAEAPADRVDDVADAPGVVLVERDRTLEPLLDESRPMVGGVIASNGLGYTGRGVTVAVFDTGIDLDHPDLEDKVLTHFDATQDNSLANNLLGGSENPAEPGDTDGHGTHVAGAVAGPGAESGYTYVGIAPDASLVSVDVFDERDRAKSSYVLRGLDWVTENRKDYRIRMTQMSIGGDPTDGTDAVSRAIGAATDRGILSVVAAGNRGPDAETVTFPGVAPAALTVGAVDGDKEVADFSSRGPTIAGDRKPDMVAPGVEITSTLPPELNGGDAYGDLSGTSMAAPHAAGTAALLWEANGSLTPNIAKWILVASTEAVGETPNEWHPAYGWGFLDAEAASKAAVSPEILGQPPYDEKAGDLDFIQDSSRVNKFLYRAGEAQRDIPSAAGAALAGLAVAALLRVGTRT